LLARSSVDLCQVRKNFHAPLGAQSHR
jgi:hypothetical protein